MRKRMKLWYKEPRNLFPFPFPNISPIAPVYVILGFYTKWLCDHFLTSGLCCSVWKKEIRPRIGFCEEKWQVALWIRTCFWSVCRHLDSKSEPGILQPALLLLWRHISNCSRLRFFVEITPVLEARDFSLCPFSPPEVFHYQFCSCRTLYRLSYIDWNISLGLFWSVSSQPHESYYLCPLVLRHKHCAPCQHASERSGYFSTNPPRSLSNPDSNKISWERGRG